MKTKLVTCMCLALFSITLSFSQNTALENDEFNFGEPEYLLDGYSMNFQYQNGTALHMEFHNGKAEYKWLVGPGKGRGNQNIDYRSMKIGEDLYLINWHELDKNDYLTIVFDFKKMIMHSSIIVGYKNKTERPLKTVFSTGVIDHLKKD